MLEEVPMYIHTIDALFYPHLLLLLLALFVSLSIQGRGAKSSDDKGTYPLFSHKFPTPLPAQLATHKMFPVE